MLEYFVLLIWFVYGKLKVPKMKKRKSNFGKRNKILKFIMIYPFLGSKKKGAKKRTYKKATKIKELWIKTKANCIKRFYIPRKNLIKRILKLEANTSPPRKLTELRRLLKR